MLSLTKDRRAVIRNAVLAHKFREPFGALMGARSQHAYDVWADIYDKDVPRLMTAPAGWFKEQPFLMAQFGAETRLLTFNGYKAGQGRDSLDYMLKNLKPSAEIQRRVFFKHTSNWEYSGPTAKVYGAREELAIRDEELYNRAQTMQEEVRTYRAEIDGVLGSTGTLARLLKIWPEVEPFVPAAYFGSTAKRGNDLAPLVSSLNEKLGLPVDETQPLTTS